MPTPDWLPPETWQVGDTLDAATLNRRIRDQFTVLLRRPLTVLTASASQTVATGTNTTITWDVITQDDDNMAMSGTPVSNIYAQREGTYQFWYNITFNSNGSTVNTLQTSVWLSNNSTTRRWDYQARAASSIESCRSVTGTMFLQSGEFFTAHAFQNSGANMTTRVANGTPSLIVMWQGIS